MAEEILLYIESEENGRRGQAPFRFPFADGEHHRIAQPIHELDRVEVVVTHPVRGARYLLRVGGKEFSPSLLSTGLIWDRRNYFANYRGWVALEIVRVIDGETATTHIECACLPSKITEEQYRVMVEEIEHISRSLILDVVGARQEVGWRGRIVTTDLAGMEEHEAIRAILDRIRPDIYRLQDEQILHLKVERQRTPCWGFEELDERAVVDLAASGVDPHEPGSRPFLCSVRRRILTTELHENRQIARFLQWLRARLAFIIQMVQAQIDQIDEDRWWRDNAPQGQKSIWELEDEPRRRQLDHVVESCKELRRAIWKDLQDLPFLPIDSGPMDLRPTSLFLRHPIYSRLYRLILAFLRTHGAIFDRADFETQARVKGTDKLYEYWIYLNIVRYLKERVGLPVEEYGGLYERSPKLGSYTLSIERSYVTFQLDEERTLRVYYSPLIFRRDEALRRGHPFYRRGEGLPYSPDFLIEVRSKEGLEMGIILDAKYMTEVSRELVDLRKYLPAIRDIRTDEAFSRMLWIFYVGEMDADDVPPCHVEVHTLEPVFLRNDASRVHIRSDEAFVVGSLRIAPRSWGDAESSLGQLDIFMKPLLDSLGIRPFRSSIEDVSDAFATSTASAMREAVGR